VPCVLCIDPTSRPEFEDDVTRSRHAFTPRKIRSDLGQRRVCFMSSFISRKDWLPLVIARFRSLYYKHGTIYQRHYAQHRLCCHLNDSLFSRPYA